MRLVLAPALPCWGFASGTLLVTIHEVEIADPAEIEIRVSHAAPSRDDVTEFLAATPAARVILREDAQAGNLKVQPLDGVLGTHVHVAVEGRQAPLNPVTASVTLSLELLLRHVVTPSFGDPVSIDDTENASGEARAFARSDHQHGHGERGGGSLHAAATPGSAGFMSSADKGKLDALPGSLADYVQGPASATTNAVARYDGTSGKLIKNSNATLADTGRLTLAESLITSGGDIADAETDARDGVFGTSAKASGITVLHGSSEVGHVLFADSRGRSGGMYYQGNALNFVTAGGGDRLILANTSLHPTNSQQISLGTTTLHYGNAYFGGVLRYGTSGSAGSASYIGGVQCFTLTFTNVTINNGVNNLTLTSFGWSSHVPNNGAAWIRATGVVRPTSTSATTVNAARALIVTGKSSTGGTGGTNIEGVNGGWANITTDIIRSGGNVVFRLSNATGASVTVNGSLLIELQNAPPP